MRRRLFLVPLVSAALLATGSGSQESPETAASDRLEAASSRIATTWRSDFPRPNETFQVTGLVDYERGSGIIESTSDDDFEPEIFTRDASYELLTNIGLEPIDKRRWLRSDPPKSALAQFDSPIMGEYFGESPTALLGFLKAAGEVEETFTDEERGEKITRYRIRLKLERAVEEVAFADRAWFRHDFLWCWSDSAKTGVPFDLAVDAKGRLRGLEVALFCKRGAEFTIEFFDYGVDVAAEAPPADEVMTHEEFDRLQLEFATEEEK